MICGRPSGRYSQKLHRITWHFDQVLSSLCSLQHRWPPMRTSLGTTFKMAVTYSGGIEAEYQECSAILAAVTASSVEHRMTRSRIFRMTVHDSRSLRTILTWWGKSNGSLFTVKMMLRRSSEAAILSVRSKARPRHKPGIEILTSRSTALSLHGMLRRS